MPAADSTSPDDVREAEDAEGPQRLRIVVRRDPRLRLDKYLRQRMGHASRHQIQKLIEHGGVTINQRQAKASALVRRDDVLEVILPPPPANYLLPQAIDLEVLFEDEHMIVVNKQAGLVVHPARSHLDGTLVNALAHHFLAPHARGVNDSEAQEAVARWHEAGGGVKPADPEQCRPGIVHRLDKNTTGAIVAAKSDAAHWRLARQFERREPLKVYLALVHGRVRSQGGVVDAPIGKHPTIREAYAVRHGGLAKHAVTLYRVRRRYRGYTLLEVELKTGRTHQIRVHMSYLAHPIVGDIIYGGQPIGRRELDDPPRPAMNHPNLVYARTKEQGQKIEAEATARSDLILCHPALHAALLNLTHPVSGEPLSFMAPLRGPVATLLSELQTRPEAGEVACQGTWLDLEKVVAEAAGNE